MLVLVGSRAAICLNRPKHDWDFFATPIEAEDWFKANDDKILSFRHRPKPDRHLSRMTNGELVSFDIDDGTARDIYNLNQKNTKVYYNEAINAHYVLADLLHLALIKRSHLTVANHWRKHVEDYYAIKSFLDGVGYRQPTAEEIKILEARVLEVDRNYPSRVNLNMENDAFFDRSAKIGRVYEHDEIHKVVAYYDVPLFEKIKTDPKKAMTNKKIFFTQLSLEDRLRTVREECYVIALERYLIPANVFDDKEKIQEAYLSALEKICTTLTKGHFREFAINHYPELKYPEVDFANKFYVAVTQQKIKPKGEQSGNNSE